MSKMVLKFILLVFALFMCCDPGNAKEKHLKAGFVYIGPVGDIGWNFSHETARLKLRRDLPDIETVKVENVHPADVEKVIESLIQNGVTVVFSTSYSYQNAVDKLAGKFPEVRFYQCGGTVTGKNVAPYFGRMWENSFLGGFVAGKMSKAGHIGFVSSKVIPKNVASINAFALGAMQANPDIRISGFWTDEWQDLQKEKDCTEKLIDGGADIIYNHVDTSTAVQVAADRGVYTISANSDILKYGAKKVIASLVWQWDVFYKHALQNSLHSMEMKPYIGSLKNGLLTIHLNSDKIPQAIQDEVNTLKEKFIASDTSVFKMPVFDQRGKAKSPRRGADIGDFLGGEGSGFWMVYGVNSRFPDMANPVNKTRVYLVHSYEQNNVCGMNQEAGICKILKEKLGENSYVTRNFFMNTKTVNRGLENMKKAAGYALEEIKYFNPDIVFTIDDNSFREVGLELKGQKYPVVFSGMNGQPEEYNRKSDFLDEQGKPTANITGVYEKLHLQDSLRIMKAVMPDLSKMVILLDTTPTGVAINKQLLKEMKKFDSGMEIDIRYVETAAGYYREIESINNDAGTKAVYNMVVSIKDEKGVFRGPDFTIREFVKRSRKPSIALNHEFARLGFFGGASVDFNEMGSQAAIMGCDLLVGKNIENYPVQDAKAVMLIFNLARAKMLGIKLPDELVGVSRLVEEMRVLQEKDPEAP